MERIMGSLAEELHDSLGGLRAGSTGPGIIKVTLLAIATKTAAEWIKNAASTAVLSGCADPRPQAEQQSTISPRSGYNKNNKMEQITFNQPKEDYHDL